MKPTRVAGIALIIFLVAFVALAAVETQRPDGDNPVLSMTFIREHENLFNYTGFANLGMSVALVVGIVGLWDGAYASEKSLLAKVGFVLGLFAAAFYMVNGALRMAGGTLLYMSSMSADYGNAAYLAVQMAGTQGLFASANLTLGLFAGLLSVHALGTGKLPKALAVAGLAGFLTPLLSIAGKLLGGSGEGLFPLYILSFVLVPIWVLGLGIWAMRKTK